MSKTSAKLRQCDEKLLRRKLTNSLSSLERFLIPDHPRCGVSKAAREEARLYLSSWVAEPLRELLLWVDGAEEKRYVSIDEYDQRQTRLKELLDLER